MKSFRFRQTSLFVLITTLLWGTQLFANQVSIHRNETTGLLTWKVEDQGFSLELIQLLPDFVRAIYSKHHFPAEEVENIAGYCVYGSILKNTSDKEMSYDVADWQYRDADGRLFPVKSKTQWLQEWQKKGITFSWTLLPDKGDFAEGDWQQGFTTIKIPVGESRKDFTFDFIYRWKLGNKTYSGTIKQLSCPPARLDIK